MKRAFLKGTADKNRLILEITERVDFVPILFFLKTDFFNTFLYKGL